MDEELPEKPIGNEDKNKRQDVEVGVSSEWSPKGTDAGTRNVLYMQMTWWME